MVLLNYLFEKMYIGTLAENKVDGVSYQGEILCLVLEGNTYVDLISGNFYEYLGHENRHQAPLGQRYIIGLNDQFPKHLGNHVCRENTVLHIARELNKEWTSIDIPNVEVKVKKRK